MGVNLNEKISFYIIKDCERCVYIQKAHRLPYKLLLPHHPNRIIHPRKTKDFHRSQSFPFSPFSTLFTSFKKTETLLNQNKETIYICHSFPNFSSSHGHNLFESERDVISTMTVAFRAFILCSRIYKSSHKRELVKECLSLRPLGTIIFTKLLNEHRKSGSCSSSRKAGNCF